MDRQIVVLVKPQFEAGRESVGKGGIVRDEQAQQASLQKVRDALLAFGAERDGCHRLSHPGRGRES